MTYAVGGPCPDAQTQTVTLSPAPQGTFTYTAATACAGTTGVLTPALGTGAVAGTFSAAPAGLAIDPATGAVTLASSLPGIYTISNQVGGTGGCSVVTATSTLTLLALPTVAITGLNLTYCSAAGPVTLAGTVNGTTAPGTFTIDGNPATVFDPAALGAGPHTVAFTGSAGGACDATVSLTVTVIATPAQPVITVQPLAGGLVMLISSQPTGNQWFLNGVAIAGATGATYTVTAAAQNGTYTVQCAVAGCPSPMSAPQNVTVTGLSAALADAAPVTLYPVPTLDGYVTLETADLRQPATVTVYDAVGRAVWHTTLAANATSGVTRHPLDLRALSVGTYVLRLTTEHGTVTRRLVRE